MTTLKKTKLKPPYFWERHKMRASTTFAKRNKSGVYIIYKNNKPVYIGFSRTDVYKALYRHFQKWSDKTQVRVTYDPNNASYKVRVIYCNTSLNADRLEKALIIKLKPKDNPQKYWLSNEIDEQEKKIYSLYKLEDTQHVYIQDIENPF